MTPEQLFAAHEHLALPAARALARRLPRRIDPDELFAAALAGLWDAARRYDPAQGNSFHSWACWRIRHAMWNWLRNPGAGGIEGKRARQGPPLVQADLSLLASPASGSGQRLLECRDLVDVALRAVSARQRRTVEWYYFEHLSMARIAERLSCSECMVSLILKEARSRMRERLEQSERNSHA